MRAGVMAGEGSVAGVSRSTLLSEGGRVCIAGAMPRVMPRILTRTRPLAALRPFTQPRFSTLRTVFALMLREMGSTYGRSPGGYLWALIEPMGMIVVLAMGFSLLVRTPPLGTSFILFYATGMLTIDIYNDASGKVASALRASKALLAYPRVTWVDAVLARLALSLLTGLTIFTILIAGILILVETRTLLDIIPIIAGLGLATAFGLGVGLVNCVLFAFFPIWRSIWRIANRPMFIVSGVIFLYEDVPQTAQEIMWWNPMLHAIAQVRTGFYPTYRGDYISLLYGYGVSLGLIALGLLLVRRHYRAVLES